MSTIRSIIDAIVYPFRLLARIPSNVISSPRRMMGLSLPLRVAIMLFFGLLLIVVCWAALIRMLDGREQFWAFFSDVGWALLALTFVIPVVVWYALKLWLEGEPSPFPDIDTIWESALKELKTQEIDPSETPIFLVLGPPDDAAVRNFMETTRIQFPVQKPEGPGCVHVWANQTAIYVVCTQICRLGKLLSQNGSIGGPVVPVGAGQQAYDPTRTLQVGAGADVGGQPILRPQPGAPPPGVAPQFGMGTAQVGTAHVAETNAPSPMQATMQIGVGQIGVGQIGGGSNQIDSPIASGSDGAIRLSPDQASEASAQLAYLCRCIRRVRDPLAPINGVLVLTPFRLLADGTQDAVNQLQIALKSDLTTLRSATRMRCSVTHLIEGMHEEAGFRELIRRVGSDRVSTQRFGKGFGLWNLPTTDQLDALVKHACGAFEDWSYLLFREDDGLGKRGNRHLYSLLCRIRLKFLPRLEGVVRNGYAIESNASSLSEREPLLFSGCYFIANGPTTDRQAFLASVFSKSRAEEEELEWGSEAIAEENRMQTGVQILLVINGILVATIAVLFWLRMSTG